MTNQAEVAFESEDDFEVEVILESDEDLNEGEILPSLATSFFTDCKNCTVDDDETQSNHISPADSYNEVVLESEDEEVEEHTLFLPHLDRISSHTWICYGDSADLVPDNKEEAISLETTVPLITDQDPKHNVFFRVKTTCKSRPNACVTLYIGRGGSFCKLETIIHGADSYGIYWCPFPKCKEKTRKRSLLKDHLKKTHHGPFYCVQCGVYFLHLPSLNRHYRRSGHSKHSDLVAKETFRRHTVAAVKRFSVSMHQTFDSSYEYILS